MNSGLFFPERMASAMDEAGLDALVVTTAPNIQYLTRYRRGGSAMAVLFRADLEHPHLFLEASNIDYILEDFLDSTRVWVFSNFYRKFTEGVELNEREALIARLHSDANEEMTCWDLLADLLSSLGLQDSVVGTDGALEALAGLSEKLTGIRLRSASDLFRLQRMIKSKEEIRRLAEAARITEHAIMTSANSACLGTTQRQLAHVYNQTVIAANSYIRSDNASIGRGSALGNLNSPRDVVEDGSILRYDVGVHYEGYASDVARCFVFRALREKEKRIHAALVEGQSRALEYARPGVVASQVFDVAVAAVRKAGIPDYERTHVGHGIGIAGAGYDLPLLAPSNQTVLQPGMVLCVETPYIELGFGGLQVEDMIVIKEDGFRFLTHTERSIQVLP